MTRFKNSCGAVVVEDMIRTIQENRDYLSVVDGLIGDGDHGINMSKGFTLCKKKLKGNETLSEALKILGTTLMAEIGGSMGPLYGSFFRVMADISSDKEEITLETFIIMLQSAMEKIQNLGSANVGDKTLLDTLDPAIKSLEQAVRAGTSFSQALTEMENAAEKGKDSTKDMIARIGRSARLGERSRGVLDAGAISCYLLLSSMNRTLQTLLH